MAPADWLNLHSWRSDFSELPSPSLRLASRGHCPGQWTRAGSTWPNFPTESVYLVSLLARPCSCQGVGDRRPIRAGRCVASGDGKFQGLMLPGWGGGAHSCFLPWKSPCWGHPGETFGGWPWPRGTGSKDRRAGWIEEEWPVRVAGLSEAWCGVCIEMWLLSDLNWWHRLSILPPTSTQAWDLMLERISRIGPFRLTLGLDLAAG